ncbi:Abi family protein [Peptacetobacter hiranonis]|uniref:Abi family protein n=1 Tax=Peptacetobacter hiranonis TaxID=89152 RepID=UPI0022E41B4F|nr:Abi family protein [Peptacetobacter hiranonis]
MANKPFKTYREQLDILRSRNLIIENEERAIDILRRVNYYNLINGYKKIFLEKSNSNLETYKENCTLEELYSLYKFDRDLKNILLYYLIQFENSLKSICAYHFSNKFREDYSYLQVKNYSHEKEDFKYVLNNLAELSKIINKEKDNSVKPQIKHYIDKHHEIPLWVLINYLTFGNVSFFFNAMDNELKESVCKDFGIRLKRQYGNSYPIEKNILKDIIKISNLFRNVCAHDDILFSYRLKKPISTKESTSKFFRVKFKGNSLFDLVMLLQLVLPKDCHEEMISKIEFTFKLYSKSFKSISLEDIIEEAGFPINWTEDYKIKLP